MVSSVDVMAYLLTIGSSSNQWRTATGNRYAYLSGRESIEDFIFSQKTISPPGGGTVPLVVRRTISVPDSTGASISVQYILHTYDETTAGESSTGEAYVAQTNGQYCHVVCLGTAVIQDTHAQNVGGKICRYDQWACNTTIPSWTVEGYHGQYEFYDYSSSVNNVDELGNNIVLVSSEPQSGSHAAAYLSQLDTILQTANTSPSSELYYIPPMYRDTGNGAHSAARCAYFTAVESITGCTPTCS